jgi:hypothetical protein
VTGGALTVSIVGVCVIVAIMDSPRVSSVFNHTANFMAKQSESPVTCPIPGRPTTYMLMPKELSSMHKIYYPLLHIWE